MKTTANTLKNIATRVMVIVAAMAFGLNLTSCSAADEPLAAGESNEQVTSARVTFTYTVPEEVFKYAEITVAYNNNEGTDAKWQPVLDPTFTVTYDLTKFPVMAPVVMIYDRTNRNTDETIDWDLKMDVEVAMNIGGRTEIKTNSEVYHASGLARQAVETIQKNVVDRTYGVKISKTGNVQFIK